MKKELKDNIIAHSIKLIIASCSVLYCAFFLLLASLTAGSYGLLTQIFLDMFSYSRLSEVPVWFIIYFIFSITFLFKYCNPKTKLPYKTTLILTTTVLNYVVIYQFMPFKPLISWTAIYLSILKTIF